MRLEKRFAIVFQKGYAIIRLKTEALLLLEVGRGAEGEKERRDERFRG